MRPSIKKIVSFALCSSLLLTCGCSNKDETSDQPDDDGIIRIACVG